MKVHLMYRDQDFDLQREPPLNEALLLEDLELDTLLGAMALGGKSLYDVARSAVLGSLQDIDAIRYRQEILKDCLTNASIVRELYQIAVETMDSKERRWLRIFGFSNSSAGILRNSVEMVQLFLDILRRLRRMADEHAEAFSSEGFTTFFAMIKQELDDDYLATVQRHLTELSFRDGVLISAALGTGNEGADYLLAKHKQNGQSWVQRVLTPGPTTYTFRIHPRDFPGARALSDLKERGLNLVANALAQSSDHINGFFGLLRTELAFYIGCLNLHDKLVQLGEPVAFPAPAPAGEREHSFTGLYDVCLALTMGQSVVGNDVAADDRDMVLITGANQGGKSTFLRSIGVAQLMMQAGMFVPAVSLRANLCTGLYTHYRRQEDATMNSDKLDEELGRMSDIVDAIGPDAMVLFNESFAATNEREGAEIAWQITHALLERRIKVFFVTHLYAFARRLHDRGMENIIFLRAERKDDGERTFRLIEGAPLATSHGVDLYQQVFGT
jgi:DNA mismatch repair ATPase MutS